MAKSVILAYLKRKSECFS